MLRSFLTAAASLLFAVEAAGTPSQTGCWAGCRRAALPIASDVAMPADEEKDACIDFVVTRPGFVVYSATPMGFEGNVAIERCNSKAGEASVVRSEAVSDEKPITDAAFAVEPGTYRAVFQGRGWAPVPIAVVTMRHVPRDPKTWTSLLSATGTLAPQPGVAAARGRKELTGTLLERVADWRGVEHVEVAREDQASGWLTPRDEGGLVSREAASDDGMTDWRTYCSLPPQGALLARSSTSWPEKGLRVLGVAPGPLAGSGTLTGSLSAESAQVTALGRMGRVHRIRITEAMDLRFRASSPDAFLVLIVRDDTGRILGEVTEQRTPPEVRVPADCLAIPAGGLDLQIDVVSRDDEQGTYFLEIEGTRTFRPEFTDAGGLSLDARRAGLRCEGTLFQTSLSYPTSVRITLPSGSARIATISTDGSLSGVSRSAHPHDLLRVGAPAVVRSLAAATDPSVLGRHGQGRPEKLEEGALGVLRTLISGELAVFEIEDRQYGIAVAGLAPAGYSGPDAMQLLEVDFATPGRFFLALFGSGDGRFDAEAVETRLSERIDGTFQTSERVKEERDGWVESVHEIAVPAPGLFEAALVSPNMRIEVTLLDPSGTLVARSRPASGPDCDDSCEFSRDGECDDGRPGSATRVCEAYTDCADCGPRPARNPGEAGAGVAAWIPAAGVYILKAASARPGAGSFSYDIGWKLRTGEVRERVIHEPDLRSIDAVFDSGRPTWRRTVRPRPGRDAFAKLELPAGRSPRLEVFDGAGRRLAKSDGGRGCSQTSLYLPRSAVGPLEIVASSDAATPDARLTVDSVAPIAHAAPGARPSPRTTERPSAPTVTFPANASIPASLEGLKGKVVVLEFWASWCRPCREGLPRLEQLHRDLGPKGLVVLGINDESSSAREKAVSEMGLTFPQVADVQSRISSRFEVNAIPRTVIVDRKGRVLADLKGLYEALRIRSLLERALAEPVS